MNAAHIDVAQIRAARTLAALHKEAYGADDPAWSEQEFARMLALPNVVALAARLPDSGAAGFLVAWMAGEDEAEILSLATAPWARRRGIGAALIERACVALAARGAARIFLDVREDNHAARALYERAGFDACGRRRGYYDTPQGARDALVLRRNLNINSA